MKYIYSLGGGCWLTMDIPTEYRFDSIFKAGGGTIKEHFLPLELFNGNLENEFLHKDFNWEIKVNSGGDCREIQRIKLENPNYVSNYLATFSMKNINNGLYLAHGQKRRGNPLNKNTWKPMFQAFNDNKYNLFYIIDFQRGGYNFYQNFQLLKFEDFLLKNNYDLKNFVYLDVNNANIKDRFNNCKIKSFVNDVNDKAGFGHKDDPNEFRNTRCFFTNHMDYVENQLNRIDSCKITT